MDNNYTYPTTEIQRVPGHRPSEPAMWNLYTAIKMRVFYRRLLLVVEV